MQLLNVLPSQSGPFLPEPYRDLMVRREGGREGGREKGVINGV
jgi:hypothetical protein